MSQKPPIKGIGHRPAPLFVPAAIIANRTGLPKVWIEHQASQGKLPTLRVARGLLYHLDLTVAALTAMAVDEEEGQRGLLAKAKRELVELSEPESDLGGHNAN